MIFLDSSILVEYSKGAKRELLIELFNRNLKLHYNAIVVTEYIYHFLGYFGTKSPRTLKENKRISTVLETHGAHKLFELFQQITDNYPTVDSVLRLMKTYNMLPNDAIILAHCLSAGIKFLASYDATDFTIPCQQEGITLIDSLDALDRHFPVS